MTVYVLAQLTFTDRTAYERYQARFMEVLRPFGGRLLVAQEQPQVIEGQWRGDKVVLIAFDDEATLRAWSGSAAYQEISKDRKAGAQATVLLLRGVDAPLDRSSRL